MSKIVEMEQWIIDFTYSSILRERVLNADTIYIYDFSRDLCIYRVIKRSIRSKTGLEMRTELPEGCTDNFIPEFEFLKLVWNYKTSKIYSIIEETNFNKKDLMIFKDRNEFKNYMKHLNYSNFAV